MNFDVAVVGAGPAGAWTACRLAERGASVVLIDGSHPREKACGGGVTGRALQMVRAAVHGVPSVAVARATFAAGGRSAAVAFADTAGADALHVVARRDFDGALLAAAQRAGARHLPARVTGVERAARGWTIAAGDTLTAGWLVGADGANSLVRRRVSAPFPRGELSIASGYYVRGTTGADIDIDFDDVPGGYVWSFPRADHLAVGACGQADATSSPALLARSERWVGAHVPKAAALDRYSWPIPSLGVRAIEAERPSGDRWLLVGDAAGLVDPITREGIYFALVSAEHAADSLSAPAPDREYALRLRGSVQDELVRAARLKAGFFRPDLLRLLVRALVRSSHVRAIMADLVAGRQAYAGLRRRLLSTLEFRLMYELFRI